MTPAQHPALTDAEILRVRQQFAEECKRMLEEIAEHACTCDPTHGVHEHTCQRWAFIRSAHAVWLKAQP